MKIIILILATFMLGYANAQHIVEMGLYKLYEGELINSHMHGEKIITQRGILAEDQINAMDDASIDKTVLLVDPDNAVAQYGQYHPVSTGNKNIYRNSPLR